MKDKEFADIIDTYVNNMTHSNKVVADECRKHHRYLQYEEVQLLIEMMRGFAKNYDENNFDGRNEHAVKACKALVEYFDSKEFAESVRAL